MTQHDEAWRDEVLPIAPESSEPETSDQPVPRDQTTAARLTGVGRSAIAVIGLVGKRSDHVLRRCFEPASKSAMRPGQIRYGTWRSGESVVVTPIHADQFEIHCHGGPAAIQAILSDLGSQAVKIVPAAAFSAATEPDQPLLIREAGEVLPHCSTERTAAILLDQVRGALHQWADAALQSLSRKVRDNKVRDDVVKQTCDQADQMLKYAPYTCRLDAPFRVVLFGSPNVGKSSLTNAIVGYTRSITMATAGTTRDVLHAETVINGIPIRMSDTAGIRETNDAIEAEGTRRAVEALRSADLLIRIRDPDTGLPPAVWSDMPGAISQEHIIDVLNKADLLPASGYDDDGPDRERCLQVSAKTGQGVQELMQRIGTFFCECLPGGNAGPAPHENTRQHRLDTRAAAINRRQMQCLIAIKHSRHLAELSEHLRVLLGR